MPRARWTSGLPRLQSNGVALQEIVPEGVAFMRLARFAFRQVGLHRLEMRVAVENVRAQVAIHKIGGRPEALLRDAFTIRRRCCDAVRFRLLKREFGTT